MDCPTEWSVTGEPPRKRARVHDPDLEPFAEAVGVPLQGDLPMEVDQGWDFGTGLGGFRK